jgi:protein SCO1/2
MTKNLMKVQEEFKDDDEVRLLSHTVKPWYDSQERLKNYEKSYNIQNGKWYLVTGKTNDIYSIARKSYYAEEEPGYNKDSTEFLHTEHVLLIDWYGHIRGVYNGTLALEIERMIEDIKTLERDRKKTIAYLSNDE